jgi:hypothetical protein
LSNRDSQNARSTEIWPLSLHNSVSETDDDLDWEAMETSSFFLALLLLLLFPGEGKVEGSSLTGISSGDELNLVGRKRKRRRNGGYRIGEIEVGVGASQAINCGIVSAG